MRQWIRFPHREGQISRQAHADLPETAPYEREMGRCGFFGPTCHLHHRHAPTGWTHWEGPLRPRAYDLNHLFQPVTSPIDANPVMANAHCQVRTMGLDQAMPALFRNGDGDDLVFVHQGSGEFFCDFGHLSYRLGDYIVIPRGTMWRMEPTEPNALLLIEATHGSFQLPEKGIVGAQALFDQAMLDIPALDETYLAQQNEQPWQVIIKRHHVASTVTFPFNPLDIIGWHGDLSACRINWRAIRPLMSHRYHLPPSAHSTFVAERFVVCTFVPRPIESDPGALRVPFYHNNDDFDEVIFYHAGDFFSRDNIKPGMLTLHPCGFTHGPHPKAFATGAKHLKTFTDEVAVMIDSRDAFIPSSLAVGHEWHDYIHSWQPNHKDLTQ